MQKPTIKTGAALAAIAVCEAASALLAFLAAAPALAAPALLPSPALTPGVGLAAYNGAADGGLTCTAGFLAHTATGQPVMLIAGHCDQGGKVSMNYAPTGEYETLGYFAEEDYTGNKGEDADMGLVALAGTLVHLDPDIDGIRPVTGSTTQVGVGDRLCKFGLTTGLQCGPVMERPTATKVRFAALVDHGDSGGPVYKRLDDGTAVAVGITIGGSDSGGTIAELVQPWLTRWNLTLDTTGSP